MYLSDPRHCLLTLSSLYIDLLWRCVIFVVARWRGWINQSDDVVESLIRHAKDFNIVLDDVAITHLSYGQEFSRAVEQKQVAERSKFVVAKAEQEKRATIIRAHGESKAAKLISDATANAGPGLIELRKIEASREIAGTLSKSSNVVYLPKGNQILMGLPR